VTKGLIVDDRGVARCWWCGDDPLYIAYHDREWGVPVVDDTRLFEKLCLEGFQSGLSWITILRKREYFREAFAGFEIQRVARFTRRDVNRLLKNAGIIRHRGKIESTINNARRAIEMIEQFGSLAGYVWQFEPNLNIPKGTGSRKRGLDYQTLLAQGTSVQSVAMSKDLKKRGWSFVGPTTVYAFMQAMGLVNDHLTGCVVRERVERARSRFKRPRVTVDV